MEHERATDDYSLGTSAIRLSLAAECDDTLSYAASQSGRRLVRSVKVTSEGPDQAAGTPLRLEISVNAPTSAHPASTYSVEFELPREGEHLIFRDIDMPIDPRVVGLLDEKVAAQVILRVQAGHQTLTEQREPLTVLAYDQWMFKPDYYESLAAFVLPGHPEIDSIATRAAELLGEATGDDSLQGYQAGPERVGQIAGALYEAIREKGLGYIDPPASFEGYGQKIRTPDAIATEGRATCLETTALYAAALARAGIRAVLFVAVGHAFVGYVASDPAQAQANNPPELRWPTELRELYLRGDAVMSSRNDLVDLVSRGLIQPVETTTLTTGNSRPFDEACGLVQDFFLGQSDQLKTMVIVDRAWALGVVPIAARVIADGEVRLIEQPLPEPAQYVAELPASDPAELDDETTRRAMDSFVGPARVRQWLASLLDLTRRNRLLNLTVRRDRTGPRCIELDIPLGLLPQVEDRVVGDPRGIELAPPTALGTAVFEAGLVPGALIEDFNRTHRLYWPSPEEVHRTVRETREEYERQEAEAGRRPTPAEVEQAAAQVTADYFERLLSRKLTGLKRSAKEIEDLTGSNSLFLTIGMLVWEDDEGKPWSAPLFLVPVRIAGSRGAKQRLVMDEGADVTPNYCLREKLKQTYDLDIEALETPVLDEAGIDVQRLLDTVRMRLRDSGIRGAAVEERTVLAILNYSTFRLWKDLRDHWGLFRDTNAVVRHLIESPERQFEDPAADAPLLETALMPVEADDSQSVAVRWAVTGRSFVLQGPPGTGKSQTITNILAGSIAEGRSVLFVAEKQPALEVVKSRLEAVGLGSFCLDLHSGGDSQAQVREKLRRQLTEAIDAVYNVDERRWDEVNARHRVKGSTLDQYRDAIHGENAAGYSVWSARQALRRLGVGPSTPVSRSFFDDDATSWEPIRDALLNATELARTVQPVADHPWSLVERVSYDELDRGALSAAVREWAAVVDGLALSAPWSDLMLADSSAVFGQFLELAEMADGGWLSPDLSEIQHPQWRSVAEGAISEARGHLAETMEVLSVLNPDVFSEELDQLAHHARQALDSGWLSRPRKLRALVAQAADSVEGRHRTAVVAEALVTAAALKLRIEEAAVALGAIPGVKVPGGWLPVTEADVAEFGAYIDQLGRLGPAGSSTPLRVPVDSMADGNLPNRLVRASVARARDAWTELSSHLEFSDAGLRRWSGDGSLCQAWQRRAPELVEDAEDDRLLELQRWGRLVTVLEPVRSAGLDELVGSLLSGEVSLGDGPDAAHRGLLEAALDERLEAGEIDRFDGLQHDRTVDEFGELDTSRRQMIRSLIPARLVDKRSFRPGERIGEYGELERELVKKRRRLPVRGLIDKYGDRLIELTPCFLMSPDSVATYLPPGSVTFDLVVFDEASQIKVAEAVGVLGRGVASVVVGDTKQMPPSTFGGSLAPSFDDDWAEDEEEFYVAEDMESILDEGNESNLAELTLSRHYRSKHESLIAFSNRAFYESSLITFPSPHREGTAISFRRVGGQFLRRASPSKPTREQVGTNPEEAAAVVEEVLERLRNPDTANESICVVTFNAPQMRLVHDLLELQGGADVADLMEQKRRTADSNSIESQLKVRNLETVQGDEADVVMFSVAFSAKEHDPSDQSPSARRVPLHFGPLNRNGGERRLNVAVTRARKEMVVFCSFDPEDLAVRDSSSLGIRLLRQFLEIARDGVERSGELRSHATTAIDFHLTEIADAMRAESIRVAERLGLSRFKIDLALGRPDESWWRVAVLLDGPLWADTESTYEREILPVRILYGLRGWPAVARVWLPSWLEERDRVVSELVELVNTDPPPSVDDPERENKPPVAGGVPIPEQVARPSLPAEPKSPTADVAVRPEVVPMFASFPMTLMGSREVLDRLSDTVSSVLVTTVMHQIIELEGPIEIERLCKTAAGCFGLDRVRSSRLNSLKRIVPSGNVRRSTLGTFVWPADLDPDMWRVYRSTPDLSDRALNEVAPQEIANAMEDFARRGGSIGKEELVDRIKAVFGISRLTAGPRSRIEKTLEWAVGEGRLELSEDRIRARVLGQS